MRVAKEKSRFVSGRKILVRDSSQDGLVKKLPGRKPKKKAPVNPITKKMIKQFDNVAGVRTNNRLNAKVATLYKKLPKLNVQVKKINAQMLKVAAEIETGDERKEAFEKLEIQLKIVEREKSVCLLAMKSICERQRDNKKQAIKEVTKEARKLINPIILEWDKMLDRIAELKKQEQEIRNAFCYVTKIDPGNSWGYIPAGPRLRVDPFMWRKTNKEFLIK